MLLSIAGALIAATAVGVAAHGIRERRALAADVRALRADLRRLARALEARAGEASAADDPTDGAARTAGADAAADDERAVHARGSRTVH